jgi:hypothetical protein
MGEAFVEDVAEGGNSPFIVWSGDQTLYVAFLNYKIVQPDFEAL